MLNRFFGNKAHYYLHLLGLSGIAAGLPLNKVVLSVSLMFLVLNLLLESNFKQYWLNLKGSKFFWLIFGLYVLHLLGLLWSNNIQYGLHDLRVKLPLLILAVVLSVKPITIENHRKFLSFVFIASLVFTSIFNFLCYHHILGNIIYDDIRGMSLFVSHVRYAVLLALGAGMSLWYVLTKEYRVIFSVVLIWFIYYMLYSQIISGIVAFGGILFLLPIYYFGRKKPILLLICYASLLLPFVMTTSWLFEPMSYPFDQVDKLDQFTSEGNRYSHQVSNIVPETGIPVGIYYCKAELKREWEKRSHINFNSLDIRNNLINENLRRYLSSKGLRKDASGVKALTDEEIRSIENGCASVHCDGILGRLYAIKYQLVNDSDPNGHSLLQRLEYWRAAGSLIKDHWLIGTGTGDLDDAFKAKYIELNTRLFEEHRHRAHNQYMTMWISFGIIGIGLFLWILIHFIITHSKQKNVIPLMFIITFVLSCLMEDTMETQIGITFFAFFYFLYSDHSTNDNTSSF